MEVNRGKVLIQFNSPVRIVKEDENNVIIERWEERTYKKNGEMVTSSDWRFKGYDGSIHSALHQIYRKDLLTDLYEVSDLESHLESINNAAQEIRELAKVIEEDVNTLREKGEDDNEPIFR